MSIRGGLPSPVRMTGICPSQIGILKIGVLPVTTVEFATPKTPALKLRVAYVSVSDQNILPVDVGGGKPGETAVNQFDSHEHHAMRADIREVATCQPDILPHHRAKLGASELNAFQRTTLNSRAFRSEIRSLEVFETRILNGN